MPDIHHRLVMNGSREAVFSALTRAVAAIVADVGVLVRPVAFEPDGRAAWRCTDGPEDWVGTEIVVELSPAVDGTVVRLAHRNWRVASDALAACATGWARMLLGLECAVALPEPDDLRV